MKRVRGAIVSGELPALDGTVTCVDCGAPASSYDHRSYFHPLDVDPVCRICNAKRGPALPTPKSLRGDIKQTNNWAGIEGGEGSDGLPECHYHGPIEPLLHIDEAYDDPEVRIAMQELKRPQVGPRYKSKRRKVWGRDGWVWLHHKRKWLNGGARDVWEIQAP
jgi:hypothetical protein